MSSDSSPVMHLRAITHKLATLPLLPTVVSRLLALSPESDNYLDEVYRLAQQDPTFSIRLIQYAKVTSSSAQAAEKMNLKNALARLGTRKIASIITTMSFMDSFSPHSQSDKNLWVHSVMVAVISRRLATLMPDMDIDSELLYISALLHDIGRFVIFQFIPDAPSEIEHTGVVTPNTLLNLETTVSGTDHVQIGKEVCDRWDVPKSITDIVSLHHSIELPTETVAERQLANKICLIQIADGYSMFLMNNLPVNEETEEENAFLTAILEHDLQKIDDIADELEILITSCCSCLPTKHKVGLIKRLILETHSIFAEVDDLLAGLGFGFQRFSSRLIKQ